MFLKTDPLVNPPGPPLNPPACPVPAVSRIIIYLYLNTHKAYTGKGSTTQEKTREYTEQGEMESSEIKKKKNIGKGKHDKSKLHYTEALEVIKVMESAEHLWARPDRAKLGQMGVLSSRMCCDVMCC